MSALLDSVLDAERRAACEANDEHPTTPANMRRCMDSGWRYVPADATDVRATWRRWGWFPVMAHRIPR